MAYSVGEILRKKEGIEPLEKHWNHLQNEIRTLCPFLEDDISNVYMGPFCHYYSVVFTLDKTMEFLLQ